MARRYDIDGQRLWNGKRPEDFTGEDVQAFLSGASSPHNGGNNDMANNTKTAAHEAPAVETREPTQTLIPEVEVNVRPIEPRGKLIAMADVTIGGLTVEGFKVFNGDNGLFVGEPSVPDRSTRSGFRRTARIGEDLKPILNEKALEGYNASVEKLVARAAAAQAMEVKPSIRQELREGAEQVARDNAERPAPAKEKSGKDDR